MGVAMQVDKWKVIHRELAPSKTVAGIGTRDWKPSFYGASNPFANAPLTGDDSSNLRDLR